MLVFVDSITLPLDALQPESDLMKISACLITKNEENNIARCINSFKDVVDEIIVVDTGSVDSTVKIAKKLGAKVFYYKWNNSFSDARNYAIKQAKGNWIIFLDADEYFFGNTGLNIRPVVKSFHNRREIDAIECRLLNLSEGGEKIISSNSTIRIFRNDKRIRYQGRIHEYVSKDGNSIFTASVGDDQILVCHTGYGSKNLGHSKAVRNLELLLDELNTGNAYPQLHAYLSITYSQFKDHENVIKHAKQFLDSGCSKFQQIVTVYIKLIWAMVETGYDFQDICQVMEQAIKDFPDHPDLYFTQGKLLLKEGRYSEALEALSKSLKFGSSYSNMAQSTSWPSYISEILALMGHINEMKNNLNEAEQFYIKSLIENKYEVNTFLKLFKILSGRKQQEIIEKLNKLYNDKSPNDISFIVNSLARLRNRDILNHYYNLFKTRVRQDEVVSSFVLLANAKYEHAFKFFFGIYLKGNDNAVLYAVTAALLSNNQEIIGLIRNKVNSTFKQLIDCYIGEVDHICLDDSHIDIYLLLLREFVLLENGEHAAGWLKLKQYFKKDISYTLGNFLYELNDFGRALEQYQFALDNGSRDTGELNYKMAFCLYLSGQYLKATQCAKTALKENYKKEAALELLNWIQDKLDSNCNTGTS